MDESGASPYLRRGGRRTSRRRAPASAELQRLRAVPDEINGQATAGTQPTVDCRLATRIGVHIRAADPVSRAGVDGQLRCRPEVRLFVDDERHRADVTIVVADDMDETALRMIRESQSNGDCRVVVVAARIDDAALLAAVEAGVSGLVRRSEATPERLVAVVKAVVTGDGSIPPDLLGRLLSQMGSLQRELLTPRGLSLNGLTQREVEVLRLVADGLSTHEIARRLSYSDRTIKNVIHDLTTRLQLRNRSHAVAYALRRGLI